MTTLPAHQTNLEYENLPLHESKRHKNSSVEAMAHIELWRFVRDADSRQSDAFVSFQNIDTVMTVVLKSFFLEFYKFQPYL